MIYNTIWHENRKRTKKQKSTWNPIFSKIAHNSLNNGRRAVLIPFLDFQYFWTFWRFLLLKSLFFYLFFWKNHQVSAGRRRLLMPFLDFKYFSFFVTEIIVFRYHFFFNHQVSERRRPLFSQEILEPFSSGEFLLNFLNLKIKMLITSCVKGVGNFWAYFWNPLIEFLIILENKENRRESILSHTLCDALSDALRRAFLR